MDGECQTGRDRGAGSAGWCVALWVGMALATWLGMQVVHEFGHVTGAWLTGGIVQAVELKPLGISRTDVRPNPQPLIERWSGPIVGSLAPVLVWLVALIARRTWAYLLRFFAGFCLIANGAYLGVGAMWPVGDADDILRIAPSLWPLIAFGIVAFSGGLAIWNRSGAAFGVGPNPLPINRVHVIGVWCVVAVILVAELAL